MTVLGDIEREVFPDLWHRKMKANERHLERQRCRHEREELRRERRWKQQLSRRLCAFRQVKVLPVKERIRLRDHSICQVCSASLVNTVHHINYDQEDNRERNLITLCPTCHGHTNGRRAAWRAFFEVIALDFS